MNIIHISLYIHILYCLSTLYLLLYHTNDTSDSNFYTHNFYLILIFLIYT